MAVFDYAVSGKSGIAHSFSSCALRLIQGDTIAIRAGSQTSAAIIPWKAAEYLGGAEADSGATFLDDAAQLSTSRARRTSGPSGEIERLSSTQLTKAWPDVFERIQHGAMVAFVHMKSPYGLFVPLAVMDRLAGHELPQESETRLQTGIRNALRLEEDIHAYRYASPAKRARSGMADPLRPV